MTPKRVSLLMTVGAIIFIAGCEISYESKALDPTPYIGCYGDNDGIILEVRGDAVRAEGLEGTIPSRITGTKSGARLEIDAEAVEREGKVYFISSEKFSYQFTMLAQPPQLVVYTMPGGNAHVYRRVAADCAAVDFRRPSSSMSQ